MKKLLGLFLFIGLISSVSCSKDEEAVVVVPQVEVVAKLDGKWIHSKKGKIVNNEEVLNDYPHVAGCAKDYIIIYTNGEGFSTSINKNVTTSCQSYSNAFTWNRQDNVIKITEFGSPENYNILLLSNTELKIKNTQNEITLFTRG